MKTKYRSVHNERNKAEQEHLSPKKDTRKQTLAKVAPQRFGVTLTLLSHLGNKHLQSYVDFRGSYQLKKVLPLNKIDKRKSEQNSLKTKKSPFFANKSIFEYTNSYKISPTQEGKSNYYPPRNLSSQLFKEQYKLHKKPLFRSQILI